MIASKKNTDQTKIKKIGLALDAVEQDARNLQKKVIKRIDEQKVKAQLRKISV